MLSYIGTCVLVVTGLLFPCELNAGIVTRPWTSTPNTFKWIWVPITKYGTTSLPHTSSTYSSIATSLPQSSTIFSGITANRHTKYWTWEDYGWGFTSTLSPSTTPSLFWDFFSRTFSTSSPTDEVTVILPDGDCTDQTSTVPPSTTPSSIAGSLSSTLPTRSFSSTLSTRSFSSTLSTLSSSSTLPSLSQEELCGEEKYQAKHLDKPLLSTNHPQPYPNNDQWCKTIYPLNGERVELVFINFSLEYEQCCTYDWLDVYNDFGDDLIGRFCGTMRLEHTVTSGKDKPLLLHFRSDYSVVGTGFDAYYRSVPVVENEASVTSSSSVLRIIFISVVILLT